MYNIYIYVCSLYYTDVHDVFDEHVVMLLVSFLMLFCFDMYYNDVHDVDHDNVITAHCKP